MTAFTIYIIGFLIVWFIDKLSSRGFDHTWDDVLMRIVISFFSWLTIAGFIVLTFIIIVDNIEFNTKVKPPRWL